MGAAEDELRDWLATWGGYVADVDLDAAAALFDADVVGFGTRAEVAEGLAALRADQWSQVWPEITGFAFDVAGATAAVSDDGTQGVLWTTWWSDGRRGRATVVLRREGARGGWRGVHTHFSLTPATGT
jgi:ketosteroid isomerase-like protein